VQFGGQTPLKLALPLKEAGVRLVGTSPDSIDLAEDRERFGSCSPTSGSRSRPSGVATSREEAREVAGTIGYPVLVRPSYVLGGRAMEIVYDDERARPLHGGPPRTSPGAPGARRPVPRGRHRARRGRGGRRHRRRDDRRRHGAHRGGRHPLRRQLLRGAALSTVAERHLATIRDYTRRIARALNVIGLMNAQFAIKDDTVYVLEVNPRASRTVPYLSKATGVPLAKVAARVMIGRTLAELGDGRRPSTCRARSSRRRSFRSCASRASTRCSARR
jgi:carbamoyl-phosphate synthase large subunit